MNDSMLERAKPDWWDTAEELIRKCHYWWSLTMFSFAVLSILEVFYRRIPLREIRPFSYLDPIILIPFLFGLLPTATFSLGREVSLFRSDKGKGYGLLNGAFRIVEFILSEVIMIYLCGIYIGGGVEPVATISKERMILSFCCLFTVISSSLFTEYLVISSYRSKRERGGRWTKIEVNTLLYMHIISLFFMGSAML